MPLEISQLKNRTRQRKLLALDGGGIRGVLSLEILLELETQLKAARGPIPEFRLSQYSTIWAGSVLARSSRRHGHAAGRLAGSSTVSSGNEIFVSAAILDRWKNLYKSEPLNAMLQ
jgi:hypothetical protein